MKFLDYPSMNIILFSYDSFIYMEQILMMDTFKVNFFFLVQEI